MGDLEHLVENKEEQDGEALKTWVKWTQGFEPGVLDLGFWHLDFGLRLSESHVLYK